MKKIKYIFIVALCLLTLTSCDNLNFGEKSLYDKYEDAYKKVTKSDSYTKNEQLNFNLVTDKKSVNFDVGTKLKSTNDDKWEIDLLINNKNQIAKGYYNEGNLYIDSPFTKIKIGIPKIFAKSDNFSLFNDYKDKDIISSNSQINNGIEEITFIIEGKDFLSKFKTLAEYGFEDFEIKDISVSDVTVKAYIDENGYLIKQDMNIQTNISVQFDNSTHDGVLFYSGYFTHENINNTSITPPSSDGYTEVTLDKAMSFLTEIISQVSDIQSSLNTN